MHQLLTTLLAATTLFSTFSAEAAEDEASKTKGGLRYTVTVQKFKNEAGWRGQWDLGNGFTTIMTDILNNTGQFTVLADPEMRAAAMKEQDLGRSGRVKQGKKTPKTGEMTPAQLMVRGSITHVEQTSGGKGGIGFKGIRIGGSKASAEVNITIYLMDTTTGQVVASKKVVGKSGKKGLSLGYSGSKLGGLTGNLEGFKKDNLGQACEHAAAQATEFLVKQLDDVAWEGTIALVNDNLIVINRGTREGVEKGNRFKVGKVKEIRDPDTGELLDTMITTTAELEIINVKDKVSYAKPLSGADKIEKGMTVMPLSN